MGINIIQSEQENNALFNTLKTKFPQTIKDGQVSLNAIKMLLGLNESASNASGYELTFTGKGLANALYSTPCQKLLKLQESFTPQTLPTSPNKHPKNAIIVGDNLDALKLLKAAYSEKIKNKTLKVLLILLICVLALPSDWSCVASLFILSFGTNRNNLKMQSVWLIIYAAVYSLVYILAIDTVYGILQMSVVLAIPIIYAYNGERGKNIKFNKFMKWFFYIYYPLHLFIIGILIQYVLK